MNPMVLQRPVGALVRPVEPLQSFDSLSRAASIMSAHGLSVVPVVEDGRLIASVTEGTVAAALARGCDGNTSVSEALSASIPTVRMHASGAEALRTMEQSGVAAVIVCDDSGRPIGVIGSPDLLRQPRASVRPRTIGGMATPYGVYLTNGTLRAGVGSWALVVTGMLMFGLFLAASIAASALDPWLGSWLTHRPTREGLLELVAVAIFMFGLRSLPIAGYHAAEHMVVHAIEREEELEPEVVARMPRVHPRCGTNIATAAVLFLSLSATDWVGDRQLQILLAALATLLVWRPLGSMVQFWVTTRPPSRRQIESGIRAGNELLERFQGARYSAPSVFQRIWFSGMPQLVAGSALVGGVVELLARYVPYFQWLQVYF